MSTGSPSMAVEIDAFAQPGEEAKRRLKDPQARVRKRHAVADAGRSKLLALSYQLRDLVRIEAEFACRLS